jgi:hypothetical protein
VLNRKRLVAALASFGILGCGEDVVGSLQILRVTPTLEVSAHSSQCSTIDSEGETGGTITAVPNANMSGRPDFWMEEERNDDGIVFKFGSGSATKADKLYRNLFFETRKLDRFFFTSAMGDRYVVSVWGATECTGELCPPDSEANEGSVCGAAQALEVVAEMTPEG